MAHFKAIFLHVSQDGFHIKPYMDIHPTYVSHMMIGQLRTYLHQLDIEIDRCMQNSGGMDLPIVSSGGESEEHYAYCCLLKQGFASSYQSSIHKGKHNRSQ